MFNNDNNKVKIDLGVDFSLLGEKSAEEAFYKLQGKAKTLTAELLKLQQIASNTESFKKYDLGITALAEDLGKLAIDSKNVDLTSVAKEVAYLESVTKSLTKQLTTMSTAVESDVTKSIDVLSNKFTLLNKQLITFKSQNNNLLPDNMKQSLTTRETQLNKFISTIHNYKKELINLQKVYDNSLNNGDSNGAKQTLQSIESIKSKIKELNKDYTIYNSRVRDSIKQAKDSIVVDKDKLNYLTRYKKGLIELERQYKVLESFKGYKDVVVDDSMLLNSKKHITDLNALIKDTDNLSMDDLLSGYNKLDHAIKSIKQNVKDLAPALTKQDSLKIINDYEKKLANLQKTINNRSHLAPDESIKKSREYVVSLEKEINRLKKAYQSETTAFLKSGHTHNSTLIEAKKNVNSLNKDIAVLTEGLNKQSHTKFFGEIAKRATVYMGLFQTISFIQNTLANGVRFIAEYDGALHKLQAVMGVSNQEAKSLEQTFMQLGQTFGGSLESINKVALDLGRAGIASKDLADATKVTIQMALLTGDTYEVSTQAIVGYYTTFGKMVAEQYNGANAMEVIGNKLAKIANDSRLTTQDIATSGNYLLQMTKNVGASIDMVGALQVALSNAGVNASTIGTSVSRFFTILKSGSKDTKDLFFQLGINTKNFVADLKKGGKVGKDAFNQFLIKLKQVDKVKFDNLTSNLQILDQKALLGVYNNVDAIIEEFKTLGETSAGELDSASIIANSYVNIWERFKNLLGEIATKIKPVTDIAVKGLQSAGWVASLAMNPNQTLDKYNIAQKATDITTKEQELKRLEALQKVTGNYTDEIRNLKLELISLKQQLKFLNNSFSTKTVIADTNKEFSAYSKYDSVTKGVETTQDITNMSRRFLANNKADELAKYLDILHTKNEKVYDKVMNALLSKAKTDETFGSMFKSALGVSNDFLNYSMKFQELLGKYAMSNKANANNLQTLAPNMNLDVSKKGTFVGYNDITYTDDKATKSNNTELMNSLDLYTAIGKASTNYLKDVKAYRKELASILKLSADVEKHDLALTKKNFNKQAPNGLKNFIQDAKSYTEVVTKLSGKLVELQKEKAQATNKTDKDNIDKKINSVKATLNIAKERVNIDGTQIQIRKKLNVATIDYYKQYKEKLDSTYVALTKYKQVSADIANIEKLRVQGKITSKQANELTQLAERDRLEKDYLKLLQGKGNLSSGDLLSKLDSLNNGYSAINTKGKYTDRVNQTSDASTTVYNKAIGNFMSNDLSSIIEARNKEIEQIKFKTLLGEKLTKKEKEKLDILEKENKADKEKLLENNLLKASVMATADVFTKLGTGQYKNIKSFLKDLGNQITQSITSSLMQSFTSSVIDSLTQSTTKAAVNSATQSAESGATTSIMGTGQSRVGRAMVAYGAGNIAGSIGDTITGTKTKAGQYAGLGAGTAMLFGATPQTAAAIGVAGLIYGGMKGSKALKDSGVSFSSGSSNATSGLDTFKDYKRSSWFGDKAWTEYETASYGIVKQTQDLFKTYGYLKDKLGAGSDIYIQAGDYNNGELAKEFTKQLLKPFTNNYDKVADEWADYADKTDTDLNQLITESMSNYFAELDKVKQAYYKSINDSVAGAKLALTNATKDLDYYKEYLNVDDVTLKNYESLYKAQMKTNPTPDTIENWNQLGDALIAAQEAEKTYYDTLRQQTYDDNLFAQSWSNYVNQQLVDYSNSIISVFNSILNSLNDLRNSWQDDTATNYTDSVKTYLESKDTLLGMYDDKGNLKDTYKAEDVQKVYNDFISASNALKSSSDDLINFDTQDLTQQIALSDIDQISNLTTNLDTVMKVNVVGNDANLAVSDDLSPIQQSLMTLEEYKYLTPDDITDVDKTLKDVVDGVAGVADNVDSDKDSTADFLTKVEDAINILKEANIVEAGTTQDTINLLKDSEVINASDITLATDNSTEDIKNALSILQDTETSNLTDIQNATELISGNGEYDLDTVRASIKSLEDNEDINSDDINTAVNNLTDATNINLDDVQNAITILNNDQNDLLDSGGISVADALAYLTDDNGVNLEDVKVASSTLTSVNGLDDNLPISIAKDDIGLSLDSTLGDVSTYTQATAEALGANKDITWDNVTFDSNLYTDEQKKNIIDTLGITNQDDLTSTLQDLSNIKYSGGDYLSQLSVNDANNLISEINKLNLDPTSISGLDSLSMANLDMSGVDVSSLGYTSLSANNVESSVYSGNPEIKDLTDGGLISLSKTNNVLDTFNNLDSAINYDLYDTLGNYMTDEDYSKLSDYYNDKSSYINDNVIQESIDFLHLLDAPLVDTHNSWKTASNLLALSNLDTDGDYSAWLDALKLLPEDTKISYTNGYNQDDSMTVKDILNKYPDALSWADQQIHNRYSPQFADNAQEFLNKYLQGFLGDTTRYFYNKYASQGYANGGYTGIGQGYADETGETVAGIVHAGEWVAPKWMVQQVPELFASLEGARKNKSINNNTYANGGFTDLLLDKSTPIQPIVYNSTTDLTETNNIMKEQLYYQIKMYKILDRIDRNGVGTYTVSAPA